MLTIIMMVDWRECVTQFITADNGIIPLGWLLFYAAKTALINKDIRHTLRRSSSGSGSNSVGLSGCCRFQPLTRSEGGDNKCNYCYGDIKKEKYRERLNEKGSLIYIPLFNNFWSFFPRRTTQSIISPSPPTEWPYSPALIVINLKVSQTNKEPWSMHQLTILIRLRCSRRMIKTIRRLNGRQRMKKNSRKTILDRLKLTTQSHVIVVVNLMQ